MRKLALMIALLAAAGAAQAGWSISLGNGARGAPAPRCGPPAYAPVRHGHHAGYGLCTPRPSGYYTCVPRQQWTPGYWTYRPGPCGRPVKVWQPARYETVMVNVWVPYNNGP